MPSSQTWPEMLRKNLTKFYGNRAKINNWSGVLAMKNLRANSKEQLKNQEAESSYVRRNLWGATEEPSEVEADEMEYTHLGDVNHPAPIIMPQPKQSNLPTIALMALSLGVGGLAAYALTKDKEPAPAQEAPEFDDSSVSIGLGRIEDYLKDGADK